MSNDSKKASSPRILIVDDSLLILTMLTNMLTSEGYLVDAVETGFGALENVSQKTYSAVILDMNLPDLNGLAVLKILAERRPNLPVIMHTGEVSQELKKECLDAGAYAFLTKPCNVTELKRLVREAVASERGNQK